MSAMVLSPTGSKIVESSEMIVPHSPEFIEAVDMTAWKVTLPEAFTGFSPQSRVQLRQAKEFHAIFLPHYTLYRSNCSTFDSINMR
jgi:hypothetical protein